MSRSVNGSNCESCEMHSLMEKIKEYSRKSGKEKPYKELSDAEKVKQLEAWFREFEYDCRIKTIGWDALIKIADQKNKNDCLSGV